MKFSALLNPALLAKAPSALTPEFHRELAAITSGNYQGFPECFAVPYLASFPNADSPTLDLSNSLSAADCVIANQVTDAGKNCTTTELGLRTVGALISEALVLALCPKPAMDMCADSTAQLLNSCEIYYALSGVANKNDYGAEDNNNNGGDDDGGNDNQIPQCAVDVLTASEIEIVKADDVQTCEKYGYLLKAYRGCGDMFSATDIQNAVDLQTSACANDGSCPTKCSVALADTMSMCSFGDNSGLFQSYPGDVAFSTMVRNRIVGTSADSCGTPVSTPAYKSISIPSTTMFSAIGTSGVFTMPSKSAAPDFFQAFKLSFETALGAAVARTLPATQRSFVRVKSVGGVSARRSLAEGDISVLFDVVLVLPDGTTAADSTVALETALDSLDSNMDVAIYKETLESEFDKSSNIDKIYTFTVASIAHDGAAAVEADVAIEDAVIQEGGAHSVSAYAVASIGVIVASTFLL